MEEQWYADRCRLREARRAHPEWTSQQLAQHTGRSLGWVKKWRRRLRDAPADGDDVLRGRSRARTHLPAPLDRAVVERILELRDSPPPGLGRVPGPRAILYYLWQEAGGDATGSRLPRSTRAVWQVLARHGRIARPPRHAHEPLDRPPPLTAWQLDFKDVTTVPGDPDGKRQHAIEALNVIDTGTSILLEARVRADFTAATALEAVVDALRAHGLPERVTIDRDPRFVGAASGRDFPTPFVRCLTCLGVEVDVCPPHRPDLNCYVERYHRSYDRECLRIHHPASEEQAVAVTAEFVRHYNEERPNQARSCGNRPPRAAFPDLPSRPAPPATVDPDAWLRTVDGRSFARKVRPDGTAVLDGRRYSIGQSLAGQAVVLQLRAADHTLVVLRRGQVLKQVRLKGLLEAPLPLDDYVALMRTQAQAHQDRMARLTRRRPAA
ncbi:MAG TPA: integrase core domain-containing protein [Longimicrobium sp.]|nr:integrase core domain-containing protein [Longimicrobium sp.]